MVGRGGVLRVDAADAGEFAGVGVECGDEEAVVPLVVDDLDEDGSGDVVGAHLCEERRWGRVDGGGHVCAGSEGKARAGLPDVDVGIDEGVGRRGGREGRGECGCEEVSAVHARVVSVRSV